MPLIDIFLNENLKFGRAPYIQFLILLIFRGQFFMLDNLRWSDLASFAFKAGENANEGVSKLAEKSDIFENFENLIFFQFFD